MEMTWTDVHKFILKERDNCFLVAPSKQVHQFSKYLPVFYHSMQSNDVLITAAWTFESLKYLSSQPRSSTAEFLLQKCRRNLIELNSSIHIKKVPDFIQIALSYLAQVFSNWQEQNRAEWQMARVNIVNSKSKFNFSNFDFDKLSYFQNKSQFYLYTGEPYLAWQHLLLSEEPGLDYKNNLFYGKYFLFSFFAPIGEVKTVLRKNLLNSSIEFLFCIIVLNARGDWECLEDLVILKLLNRHCADFTVKAHPYVKFIKALKVLKFQTKNMSQEVLLYELEDLYCRCFELKDSLSQVLILASLLRLLKEKKHMSLHVLVERVFCDKNLVLSKGKSIDIWKFHISEDKFLKSNFVEENTIISSPEKEVLGFSQFNSNLVDSSIEFIPCTVFGRLGVGFSFTYALGKILGLRRFGYFLAGQHYKLKFKDSEVNAIVNLLSEKMSDLKGPVMKIGQTLSYTQTSLPSELALLFQRLQDRSQPLIFSQILDVLNKMGSRQLLEEIADINPKPIGIGSIGQVHQALLKNGKRIALKIKYPEIENIVKSDFCLLRLMANIFKLINPNFPLMAFINQLEKNILIECNYTQEMESIERFYNRFSGDIDIIIPQVHRELSSPDVLVTSYEEGHKFDEINNYSLFEKNHLARTLVRFVVSSCRDGDFNTDPHPGNFLFRKGKLICLDFGSTNRWNSSTIKGWNLMILASVKHNESFLHQAIEALGARTKYSDKYFSKLFNALTLNGREGFWTCDGEEKILRQNLCSQLDEIIHLQKYFKMPSEIIFGMRVYFGHLAIISLLGAQHNWSLLVNEIMDEFNL
jgi:hypothetical protein